MTRLNTVYETLLRIKAMLDNIEANLDSIKSNVKVVKEVRK